MTAWQRFKQLMREPNYRTKLVVFILLGTLVIVAAFLIRDRELFWSEVLVQFAVVFLAVASTQLIWDFLGGDVMESRISEIQKQVGQGDQLLEHRLNQAVEHLNREFVQLEHSMTLLSDLLDGNIGIDRIWQDRRTWQSDPNEGLRTWQARVCQARNVDMLGNTMWNNWFHEEKFCRDLFSSIARGSQLRLLIYDPDAQILKIRAVDEKDPRGEMRLEIESTLKAVAEYRELLDESCRNNIQVRLTHKSFHLAQIIRADDELLLAIYLSGKSGGLSPTMKLRGPQSVYYYVYTQQFEILWERAREVEPTEFAKILKAYKDMENAPFES